MRNILVTGGKGQLASCIKNIAEGLEGYHFKYVDLDELDITEPAEVNKFFEAERVSFCVNCAAFTAVDKAETELELASSVNKIGAQYLAEACNRHGAALVQVSTDFVFDGGQTKLYTEEDVPHPLGVYGVTKLQGENAVINTLKEHFIIRTSWLYSEHGHNFLKTMLRLGEERDSLSVVCDQIGTPTYAGDLAKAIIKIITDDFKGFGTYHYKYESGREGDFMVTGFSPRKQALAVYIIPGFSHFEKLMAKLGEYKTGKSCLYIKRLADVDEKVLERLIDSSVKYMHKTYKTW